MGTDTYLLAGQTSELDRLLLQAQVWEPSGRRLLEQITDEVGTGRGGRALDVGCGALGWLPLLSAWVGPDGEVVGSDIEPSLLEVAGEQITERGLTNVVLVEDDILTTRLKPASFDLVHARFVLTPVGRSEQQIRTYLDLLRPGGVVVLEDPDFDSWHFNPPAPACQRLIELVLDSFPPAGGDLQAGPRAPEYLESAGVASRVHAEVLALPPGHPYLRLPIQMSTSLAPRIADLVPDGELDRLRERAEAELAEPGRWGTTFTLVQAWGQRPG